jgi:hypothetical protein
MVHPIIWSHSDQEQSIEDSTANAVHPPLDDSGIQSDTWNSVRDSRRTNSNAENQHFILPADDDLEGAVGYSPNARAMPAVNNIHAERRQSYWESNSGSLTENRSLRQRRHSSGELSGRRWSYENYIGHSHSNQFGPGERRASAESGPQERQASNQSGPMTGRYDNWNIPEVLNPNHNHFATQYVYPPGISHETVILGSHLYIRFLYEEILRRNLQAPECLNPNHADPPPVR